MHFYLIANTYNKTGLKLLDKFSRQRKALENFVGSNYSGRAGLFFTCNRIELYGVAQDRASALKDINLFACNFPALFERAEVKLGSEEVLRHFLSLACGLYSQLKGEIQILEQISAWVENRDNPQQLRDLWRKVLLLTRDIRREAGLSDQGLNVVDVIFKDIEKQVGLNKHLDIVILGTGKIALLIPAGFARNDTIDINNVNFSFIAHKNFSKAQELAKRSGGQAFDWDVLDHLLIKADVLISATRSPHYVLSKDKLLNIVSKRKNKLLIYDLALPLDIDPEVATIEGIKLQNTEDLDVIFAELNAVNIDKIKLAEYLVEEAANVILKPLKAAEESAFRR